jgi:hypothetical protein
MVLVVSVHLSFLGLANARSLSYDDPETSIFPLILRTLDPGLVKDEPGLPGPIGW